MSATAFPCPHHPFIGNFKGLLITPTAIHPFGLKATATDQTKGLKNNNLTHSISFVHLKREKPGHDFFFFCGARLKRSFIISRVFGNVGILLKRLLPLLSSLLLLSLNLGRVAVLFMVKAHMGNNNVLVKVVKFKKLSIFFQLIPTNLHLIKGKNNFGFVFSPFHNSTPLTIS